MNGTFARGIAVGVMGFIACHPDTSLAATIWTGAIAVGVAFIQFILSGSE